MRHPLYTLLSPHSLSPPLPPPHHHHNHNHHRRRRRRRDRDQVIWSNAEEYSCPLGSPTGAAGGGNAAADVIRTSYNVAKPHRVPNLHALFTYGHIWGKLEVQSPLSRCVSSAKSIRVEAFRLSSEKR